MFLDDVLLVIGDPRTLLSPLLAQLPREAGAGLLTVTFLVLLVGIPNLFEKCLITTRAWVYFALSKDSQNLKSLNTPAIEGLVLESERSVVFIRHGESAWNEVFNNGSKILLPVRLARALAQEMFLLFQTTDSLFLDSPLTKEGLQEAMSLESAIAQSQRQEAGGWKELKPTNCVYVSSPLRRALTTLILAVRPRLKANPLLKIDIWDCLQEISRNVDTWSRSVRGGYVTGVLLLWSVGKFVCTPKTQFSFVGIIFTKSKSQPFENLFTWNLFPGRNGQEQRLQTYVRRRRGRFSQWW